MEDNSKSGVIMCSLIIILLVTLVIGVFVKKQDVLVKETNEYLYYKEYKIFNLDSVIYKYHKPITYDGKVINKYTTGHFVGVAGKGGHHVTDYHLIIQFNNRTYEETWQTTYDRFNNGENLKVVEKFYPRYEIILIKNK